MPRMPREPPVDMSRQMRLRARFWPGVGCSVVTFEQSHSSSSATICARPVSVPWPISERAMRITTVSSGLMTTQALTSGWVRSALAFESDELLGLSSFVASHSRGMPVKVAIEGGAAPHFEHGRMLYERRIGQMNLACLHCHEQNAGRRLLAETISQGHSNAYPIYRLEWQALGSLQRRLRACYSGVRAELPAYNAPDLLDLSLFLAWRGEGLLLESPGVRR